MPSFKKIKDFKQTTYNIIIISVCKAIINRKKEMLTFSDICVLHLLMFLDWCFGLIDKH